MNATLSLKCCHCFFSQNFRFCIVSSFSPSFSSNILLNFCIFSQIFCIFYFVKISIFSRNGLKQKFTKIENFREWTKCENEAKNLFSKRFSFSLDTKLCKCLKSIIDSYLEIAICSKNVFWAQTLHLIQNWDML